MRPFVLLFAFVAGCSSNGAEEPAGDAIATESSAKDTAAVDSLVTEAAADVSESRGPAYEAGTAGCPSGGRRIKLVNNCRETRWFKLDARTTPTWARPPCAWSGETCTDNEGTAECTAKVKDAGNVYCKSGKCGCNPYFELAPGKAHEIVLPPGEAFPSGTGWLAGGCNPNGTACALGDQAAKNSTFEWTYDKPGGSLYYDISAVNAWTTVSAVGIKSCGGAVSAADEKDRFRCGGAGCRFDVVTQCPDGSAKFTAAPSGCITCPTKIVAGKQVLGECGPCPNGASANQIPSNTVFNPGGIGGPEWTWTGAPDFATKFGIDEGVRANRRYACNGNTCSSSGAANTCLGGCDLCTVTKGVSPDDPACVKYCCPDITRAGYRYDSAGCTALGVQRGTDYTATLKAECPLVYTYGYEDRSSTFICDTSASLLIQACPDAVDFPSKF